MVTLWDQREHPSMQVKMCLYGILTDASGCQQRSSDAQQINHISSGHLLVPNTTTHVTTSRFATLVLARYLRKLENRTN